MGWLAAAVVLLVVSVVVFAGGLRGPAVAVTVADDAVVRWLATLRAPGLLPAMRALAALGSWVAISALLYGLLAALLILRRLRQLLIVLAAWIMQGVIIQYIAAPLAQRPRPFGVVFRTGWDAWALPSEKMAALVVTLLGILYALVPEGRWRQRGKWAAAAVVLLVAIAHLYLGVLAPTDVLVGVAVGVAIPLAGFRLFAPGEVFPVTYRRGSTAHLDVGGSRGQAIRRALQDQLGLVAGEVEPFGLAGSAGSTPLRIKLRGDPGADLFGKLYARSHLRSDRWYKLGRELLYGRLEDERPFHTVRRLVQQEDYALRVLRDAGLPTPAPYGFVELTPEREYLLVTEFFDGATELGEADVGDPVIDDGLRVIRKLWDAGLAHRDIKPANLLVRDDRLLLIDVAFAEARPRGQLRPPRPDHGPRQGCYRRDRDQQRQLAGRLRIQQGAGREHGDQRGRAGRRRIPRPRRLPAVGARGIQRQPSRVRRNARNHHRVHGVRRHAHRQHTDRPGPAPPQRHAADQRGRHPHSLAGHSGQHLRRPRRATGARGCQLQRRDQHDRQHIPGPRPTTARRRPAHRGPSLTPSAYES